jgi:integrating conjugative element protein (TIGR03758 family)
MKAARHAATALVAAAVHVLAPACDHTDFLHDLAQRESGLNPAAINAYGYAGLFQMGEGALQDAGYYRGDLTRANDWTGAWTGRDGITSLSDFRAHPDAQVRALVAYHGRLLSQIRSFGLDRAIGSMIDGVEISLSGLVAGAHLVGIGNLQRFVNSGGSMVPRDGNGVAITTYVAELGNCNIDSSVPTFAAVANALGGAGAGLWPIPAPGAGVPASPSPLSVDPDTAFSIASGRSPFEVREAITLLLAMLLFLWLAWTAMSLFQGWRKYSLSLFAMQADVVRATVLLCVLLVILQ